MGQEQSRRTSSADLETDDDSKTLNEMQKFREYQSMAFIVVANAKHFVSNKPPSIDAILYPQVCKGDPIIDAGLSSGIEDADSVIKSEILTRSGKLDTDLDNLSTQESCRVLRDLIPSKYWWTNMKTYIKKENVTASVQRYMRSQEENEQDLRAQQNLFQDLENCIEEAPPLDRDIYVYKTVKSEFRETLQELKSKTYFADYFVFQTATWSPVFEQDTNDVPLVFKIRLPSGTKVLLLENYNADFLIQRHFILKKEEGKMMFRRTTLYDHHRGTNVPVDLYEFVLYTEK